MPWLRWPSEAHSSSRGSCGTAEIMAPHPKRAVALAQMREALTERGYFYASNVDCLPQEYIQSVYAYAGQLHALPAQEKQRCARPKGTYSGADASVNELAYEVGSTASVRAFDYSRVRFPTSGHVFPEATCSETGQTFVELLDELYERQDQLAVSLMTAFEEMFALAPGTFSNCFSGAGQDMGTIRLLHYPAAASAEEAKRRQEASYGISPHTDFEAFTLMHQNAAGLQFLAPGGEEWLDAPVKSQEFVVIVGDVLERFTNGTLKATPHRVLQTPWERYSIIRFNAMTPETLIQPLPHFVSASKPAMYTPVTMQKHMDTTLSRLEQGLGSWEKGAPGRSLSASYVYDEP
ncbi:unnamed protein product [Effrenium voratum]|uniref:Fe2OG dioxygenase domain-containing protein n=1 Tax=Effrenium voratum TaxID=2562239 RepID=A0AA36ITL3_9DINO|nr:unnamed protein product [Effrenium voratum]CAJ1424703.1 unnamed protein product [Effrenium voratum]